MAESHNSLLRIESTQGKDECQHSPVPSEAPSRLQRIKSFVSRYVLCKIEYDPNTTAEAQFATFARYGFDGVGTIPSAEAPAIHLSTEK